MEENNSSSGGVGILSVVGTGPGSIDYLTQAARTALAEADIVIGYKTYLSLVADLLEGKTVVSSAMLQEVDRVKKALQLAEEGNRVALVSGGDPGIYAMAGLVYEIARATSSPADIRVIAGIAALSSCAERLGAPLMHDFAAISLSDLLTPWQQIEQRLDAAAQADFVIVLYNPKSKKRTWQLERALEVIRRHRSDSTVVGIVKAATRTNEHVSICTLGHCNTQLVDMQTTIFVGNSRTFSWRGKMITPRGYTDKYELSRA